MGTLFFPPVEMGTLPREMGTLSFPRWRRRPCPPVRPVPGRARARLGPIVGDARPVLFVGDLHLGRRAPGVRERLAGAGVDPRLASAAAAWERTVAWALERGVRAVVLAGDVVDADRDRFEAYGQLERGVRRLTEAGIAVAAVAGNHDWLALPRLAERVPGVHLLGAGGRWEVWPVPGDGPALDLLGWSFPGRTVHEDPTLDPSLEAALAARRPGARLVGLVHGDLDTSGSPHAPLDRRRLEALDVDAWLLGHVHRPDPLGGPRPVGYLGSVAGLDPGEPGPHGPWELEVEGGSVHLVQVPLAPVRYERLEVDVSGAPDADAVWDALRRTARAALGEAIAAAARWLEAVLLRVRLGGTVTDRSGVRQAVAAPAGWFEIGGVPCLVERLEDATRPEVDLEALAREPSPAGEVARLILELERSGMPPGLEAAVAEALAPWRRESWRPPEGPEPPPPREALARAAWRALELLLAHRREAAG